jgi:hypothetical protein
MTCDGRQLKNTKCFRPGIVHPVVNASEVRQRMASVHAANCHTLKLPRYTACNRWPGVAF